MRFSSQWCIITTSGTLIHSLLHTGWGLLGHAGRKKLCLYVEIGFWLELCQCKSPQSFQIFWQCVLWLGQCRPLFGLTVAQVLEKTDGAMTIQEILLSKCRFLFIIDIQLGSDNQNGTIPPVTWLTLYQDIATYSSKFGNVRTLAVICTIFVPPDPPSPE